MKNTRTRLFNNGKTAMTVAETAMNMWIVWRQDSGAQGNVKQFTNRDEAIADYESRCEFLQSIQS